MTIAACFLPLIPLHCRPNSDKAQICESNTLVKTHGNMTIPACFLVVVFLPCRPDSRSAKFTKSSKTHENIMCLACFLLAFCLLWLAPGLLCMACVLLPSGRFAAQAWCFLHVCPALSGLLLARSVGPVLSGSGLLCPGRGQHIVNVL